MAAIHPIARDRTFFTTMALVSTLVVVLGFGPGFFRIVTDAASVPLTAIYHLHGAVFALWMMLFVVQSALIARGNRALHMRLGASGAALGFLMIVLGFWVTLHAARNGFGGPLGGLPDPIQAMAIPFFDMFVFAPLFIAGLLCRRRAPEAHRRLMLMATVGGLLGAAIGRAPMFIGHPYRQLVLYLVLVLAGPAYDLITRRRIHPAYLLALLLCLLLLPNIRLWIGSTQWWHALAGALL